MKRRRISALLSGAALVLLASLSPNAEAKQPQTLTFTSAPPAHAAAGESYAVSATSSAGVPVELATRGACSFVAPTPGEDEPLEREAFRREPEPELDFAPRTVYFLTAGFCTIEAEAVASGEYEVPAKVEQSFPVASDPAERISFVSSAPSRATVGETYQPTVRLSAGIWASFTTTTPSVCVIQDPSYAYEGATVGLTGVGECTIAVRQQGVSASEPPAATQSFAVRAGGAAQSRIALIGPPRIDHKTGAIALEVACSGPGRLRVRASYARHTFSGGTIAVTAPAETALSIHPDRSAKRTLERARERHRGLRVRVRLTFEPSATGAVPASLERSILVRLY